MNYGTCTRLTPEQLLQLAVAFFGAPGIGLAVESCRPDGLDLAGPRGRVSVRTQSLDGSTEVFLTTQNLDSQVQKFMVEIYEEMGHIAGNRTPLSGAVNDG